MNSAAANVSSCARPAGTRSSRADALSDRVASRVFWGVYRRFVQPEIHSGGVDVFGCNRRFRDRLLALEASNTSLVGQLVWLGFRRKTVPYERAARRHGKSAWSFRRKLDYLLRFRPHGMAASPAYLSRMQAMLEQRGLCGRTMLPPLRDHLGDV